MQSGEILAKASELVGGDRQKTHGDKLQNHQNIARLWQAYLDNRRQKDRELSALDAALMMALLKISRTQLGDHNPDDYIDLAGYAGVAGEISSQENA
jgi:hypothetical protein